MGNKQQTEEFSIGNLENQFCITLPVLPEEADFLPRLAAYQAEHDDLPERLEAFESDIDLAQKEPCLTDILIATENFQKELGANDF